MRATTWALIGVLTLTMTGAAFAQDDMAGMSVSGAPAAKSGKSAGVVKAIDTKANTVTIQHGPIPAVGWPAMTMTFKARPATLLDGLKLGETVDFDVTTRGMDAEVTAVHPH